MKIQTSLERTCQFKNLQGCLLVTLYL
jgi:hypothetical protein